METIYVVSRMKEQTLVIVPAYNEASQIKKVLTSLKQAGLSQILVVDDGSTDDTALIAERAGATVIQHTLNRGMGAATQTGISWGLKNDISYFLTIDADAQQRAQDLKKIREKLSAHPCVIGSRFLQANRIPLFRRIANRAANWITGAFFGVWVSDSQSGLRGFDRSVAEKLNLHADGFEFCSEFIREVCDAGFPIVEIPIHVSYSQDSMAKGQNFSEGLKTFGKLFLKAITR
jgi:glycosyltransferase involved in cell wall biosynthesis